MIFYPNNTRITPSTNPNASIEYTLLYNDTCSSADLLYGPGACPDVRYALQRTVDQAICNIFLLTLIFHYIDQKE